jgi:hypothetical protein
VSQAGLTGAIPSGVPAAQIPQIGQNISHDWILVASEWIAFVARRRVSRCTT